MNLINNSSDEALEKLYIDPFNNSPYLDSNKIINKQKIDHFVYLSYIHPEKKELINKLEENIKEINIDLPFLKESLYKIHELNLLSFFEQFIDYKAIKETDQD
jgi:hypothetical protein